MDPYEALQDLIQNEGLEQTLRTLSVVLRDSEEDNDERDNAALPHLDAAVAAIQGA
jgi:hypothetical protein